MKINLTTLGATGVIACLGWAWASCGDNPTTMGPPIPAEFGLDERPPNPSCKAPARPPSTAPVALQQVYAGTNLGTPLMMAQIPGDPSRWFVAQRDGRLVSFPTANPPATTTAVANLPMVAGVAINTNGEGGFLGLAFHPRFAQNRNLYASSTSTRAILPASLGIIRFPCRSDSAGNGSLSIGFPLARFTVPLWPHQPGLSEHPIHPLGITTGPKGEVITQRQIGR